VETGGGEEDDKSNEVEQRESRESLMSVAVFQGENSPKIFAL
jgi:hypothetical protein